MRYLHVAFIVVICLCLAVTDTFAYAMYNHYQLFQKVNDLCCKKKRAESAVFLSKKSVAKRALHEECCVEGCSYEEVFETNFLLEECTQEGCSNEEIDEAC